MINKMNNYIFPIIKKERDKKKREGVRIPLYDMPPPLPMEPPQRKDKKNKDVDVNIVDFNIDGNIVEIKVGGTFGEENF